MNSENSKKRCKFTDVRLAEEDDLQIIHDNVWSAIDNQPNVVIDNLEKLAGIHLGFPVDNLTHSLQAAKRAELANEPDEVIAAALCHDIGKVLSVVGHEHIAAEFLTPYLPEKLIWTIRHHQLIQGRTFNHIFNLDTEIPASIAEHPFFEFAVNFVEKYDAPSFDVDFNTPKLADYESLIRKIFERPIGIVK